MELSFDVRDMILRNTMDSVLLDLERARMQREDYRQGNGAFTEHHTWRQMVKVLKNTVDELEEAIEDIREKEDASSAGFETDPNEGAQESDVEQGADTVGTRLRHPSGLVTRVVRIEDGWVYYDDLWGSRVRLTRLQELVRAGGTQVLPPVWQGA